MYRIKLRDRVGRVFVALAIGLFLTAGPASAANEAVTITPVVPDPGIDGEFGLSEHVAVDITFAALNLGAVSGVDGVTINFSASDAGLSIGSFTPGTLLSGWTDATSRPPFPNEGWSFVNISASDITTTGSLGTLDVWATSTGDYTLDFDVTTSGVKTEVAGYGTTFALTANSAVIPVPEPASIVLLGLGFLAVRRRRK